MRHNHPASTSHSGRKTFMPKKRSLLLQIKPGSSPHPSLATSRDHGSQDNISDRSVNDLIQHLRQSQMSRKSPAAPHEVPAHTVHPSLRDILQVPNTPIPRPRAGMARNTRRGIAGPAPPKSWLVSNIQKSTDLRDSRVQGTRHNSNLPLVKSLGGLPGMEDCLPREQSLVHQTLKALACNWNWHVEYDQCYLAILPIRHKEALLAYISVYSPHGINNQGLKALFLDATELEDATGSETLTHLDLTASIGHALVLKDLTAFFTKTLLTNPSLPPISPSIPDSWDLAPPATIPSILASPRFPSLTHLSLSHPLMKPPLWRSLLPLLPHLTTLTHLSLAYWPAPCLTSRTSASTITTPYGTVTYPPTNFYSGTGFDDWVEAANLLQRLSKATCCLKLLDLTGCGPWISALDLGAKENSAGEVKVSWGSSNSARYGGINWCGGWRSLETIIVAQGWIPKCLESETAGRHVMKGEGIEGRQEGDDGLVWDTEDERRKWQQKSELETWLGIECDIDAVERGRATRIGGVVRKRLDGGCRPVRFERGWEGWWIEDLIREYARGNGYC